MKSSNKGKDRNQSRFSEKTGRVSLSSEKWIDSYPFFGYRAKIFKSGNNELEYNFDFATRFLTEYEDLNVLTTRVKKALLERKIDTILNMSEIIDLLKEIIQSGEICSVGSYTDTNLVLSVLFSILGLKKIGPLLIDPRIDEIFFIPRAARIYLDHSDWGRCLTNLKLNDKEVQAFINRVKIENKSSVTRFNPSLKGEINTPFFHVRVTLDIPPLSVEGACFNIRKFRKKRFPLYSLLLNNTLDINTAVFLIFCLVSRTNITVFGPPASGKTTLVSAVMEYLPFNWRLISIEDVIETFSDYPVNQIKFKVDPFEKEVKNTSKEAEVIKLLHRSPDFLNLGEITTPDHSKALLQALSSGIPSILTIHGRNINGLLLRFKKVFNFPEELIKFTAPHVFVHIDAFWSGTKKIRKIYGIYEVNMNAGDNKDLFIEKIALFNPKQDRIITCKPFIDTFTFKHFVTARGADNYELKYNSLIKMLHHHKNEVFNTAYLLETEK